MVALRALAEPPRRIAPNRSALIDLAALAPLNAAMFGLPSIQKLIVLAAVIAAVWYGFKFLGRLQEARKAEAKLREANSGRPAKKGNSPQSSAKGGGQVEVGFVEAGTAGVSGQTNDADLAVIVF